MLKLIFTEALEEPLQTSKIESFATITRGALATPLTSNDMALLTPAVFVKVGFDSKSIFLRFHKFCVMKLP